jgi:ABC-2 type transport system permease protein
VTAVAPLLRQRLRRDALQLILWIGTIAALTFGAFAGIADTFGTEQERAGLVAVALANPVILVFRGLPSGTGEGAFLIFLILPFLILLVAFMASFLAVRHTRADEETGRTELVGATPAGRWAPFWATVAHGTLACVVAGAVAAVALIASGQATAGSVLAGAALAGSGVVFLGVGLLAAQLVRSARAANSIAVLIIVGSFVVAGVGNALGTPSDDLTRMESSWLAWFSPFAWAENVRPLSDDDPLPLLLCTGAFVVFVGAAALIQARRDIGEGALPERAGPASAGRTLSSTPGLVWRLSAGSIVAWALGSAVVGALSATLGGLVEQVGTDNPQIAAILERLAAEGSMDQGVLVTFFVMVGVLAACFGVQTIMRARQEETHGTAEPTLATPLARAAWLGAFLLVAVVGIIVICAAAIGAAALAIVATEGASSLATDAVVVGAGQAVAASVFVAAAAVVFVLAPRATIPIGWGIVIAAAALALFGTIFGLPAEIIAISPFAATPVPGPDAVDPNGLWWMLPAAAAGAAASLALMRRRELATGG